MLEKALELWVKLDAGQLVDHAFPGSSLIVDYLNSVSDANTILKYISSVLEKDHELALTVF